MQVKRMQKLLKTIDESSILSLYYESQGSIMKLGSLYEMLK